MANKPPPQKNTRSFIPDASNIQCVWITRILQRRVGQNSSTAMWTTHFQSLGMLDCSFSNYLFLQGQVGLDSPYKFKNLKYYFVFTLLLLLKWVWWFWSTFFLLILLARLHLHSKRIWNASIYLPMGCTVLKRWCCHISSSCKIYFHVT